MKFLFASLHLPFFTPAASSIGNFGGDTFLDVPADVTNYSSNSYGQSNASFSAKKYKKFFKKSPYVPFILVFGVVIVICILVFRGLAKHPGSQNVLSAKSSGSQVVVDPPKSQESLNREFLFPLKDDSGKEVSKIKYEIQSAEIRDQIIIKGEKATAVQGRTFLILNLKITNTYQKSIQLNVRDYVRLSVNNSDEKLAPDIHNDPVEVQAISTKYTRLGFPINIADKNLVLQIGEIAGSKQTIRLELK